MEVHKHNTFPKAQLRDFFLYHIAEIGTSQFHLLKNRNEASHRTFNI